MKWNQKTYQEFITYLKSCSEKEYQQFSKTLTPTNYEILGVRVPILRKIAKEIAKSDIPSFLEQVKSTYYEEVLVEGFVLGRIKGKELLLQYLPTYIPLIDNWAICDGFCSSLKIVKKDKPFWFSYFTKYVQSNEIFKIRVGLVVFLDYFVEEEYLENLFALLDAITIDSYYVNMAMAWLLCECYIFSKEKTLAYLKKSKINDFTLQKTISKIKDSYRVSIEDKAIVSSLKR